MRTNARLDPVDARETWRNITLASRKAGGQSVLGARSDLPAPSRFHAAAMQPGESAELETPVPRIVFAVGWLLFLPFLVLSIKLGSPTPWTYGFIAGAAAFAGFVFFTVLTVRKFWYQAPVRTATFSSVAPKKTAVPPPPPIVTQRANTPVTPPPPRNPGPDRPPAGIQRTQRPVYTKVRSGMRALNSRDAALKQRELQGRGPRGTSPSSGSIATPRRDSRASARSNSPVSPPVHTPRQRAGSNLTRSRSRSGSGLVGGGSPQFTPVPVGSDGNVVTVDAQRIEVPQMVPLEPPPLQLYDPWHRPWARSVAVVKTVNMLLTEGPLFALLVATVVTCAVCPIVGAYMLSKHHRFSIPVQGGFWVSAVAIFISTLLFAAAYAYMREATLRITESDDARRLRKRQSKSAQFDFRGRRRRCRDVMPCLRRIWRNTRRCFAGRLVGVEAGRLFLQGAIVGIGLFVGYAALAAFIIGALAGSVLLAIMWASATRTGAAIFVAIFSSILALCVCPLLWYCYCSKTARRAAQYGPRGAVKNDHEW